jgi:hypothetical protein
MVYDGAQSRDGPEEREKARERGNHRHSCTRIHARTRACIHSKHRTCMLVWAEVAVRRIVIGVDGPHIHCLVLIGKCLLPLLNLQG